MSVSKTKSMLPKKIINAGNNEFKNQFNNEPFIFSHNLENHPLFKLPRLIKLANALIDEGGSKKIMCYEGNFSIDKKWSERSGKEGQVEKILENIETSNSWLLLQDVHLDSEYNNLMHQIIDEAEHITGASLRSEMTWLEAFIFIASPNSATSYHIDSESNFLFQIHGEKEDNLFDKRDRTVLTEQEIESFYSGYLESAKYRPENQGKANVFHLTPGTGIYHPVNAPHWVKNGNSYSITLTILFYLRRYDLRARVYQANYLLRKLGFNPTPPGYSKVLDNIKINIIGLFSIRNPTRKGDVIRSGIDRILSPFRIINKARMWLNSKF